MHAYWKSPIHTMVKNIRSSYGNIVWVDLSFGIRGDRTYGVLYGFCGFCCSRNDGCHCNMVSLNKYIYIYIYNILMTLYRYLSNRYLLARNTVNHHLLPLLHLIIWNIFNNEAPRIRAIGGMDVCLWCSLQLLFPLVSRHLRPSVVFCFDRHQG